MYVQKRKVEDEAVALTAHLEQLLLTRDDTHAGLNLKALSIIRGTACWMLHIDGLVLAGGGSALMALAAAVHKALQTAVLPRVSVDARLENATAADIDVDGNPFSTMSLDVCRLPVVISACQARHPPTPCACKLTSW